MLTWAEVCEWFVSIYHRSGLCGHRVHTRLFGVWQHPAENLRQMRRMGTVVEGRK
jgi:hypothetical protein